MSCEADCRLALGRAVCHALDATLAAPSEAVLLQAEHALPLLRARSSLLWRDFGCEADGLALRSKAVENGKSGSAFLTPGGAHVDPEDGSTYAVLLKQLNSQESALLPTLYPELAAHYSRKNGSLLTPMLGWLRWTPQGSGRESRSRRHSSQTSAIGRRDGRRR